MKLEFLALLFVVGLVESTKIYRVIGDADESRLFRREDRYAEIEVREAESSSNDTESSASGCGLAPKPGPLNAEMTSTKKEFYNFGDIITYKCSPRYMRLVEGSLQVTCQSSGHWTALPVCQSFTYGCRRSKLAREYKGRLNRTRCGQPCQPWTSTTPNKPSTKLIQAMRNPAMFPEYKNFGEAENFCRNPDPDETTGPWCFLNEGRNDDNFESRWGYCDVTFCDPFDIMEDYDRLPGACGCRGSWYDFSVSYGNIKIIEEATLLACKRACDESNECQGMVFDENLNKCWLKKCTCSDDEIECNPKKHETYYRKKRIPCPGIERYNSLGRRACYFSLYNFNLTATMAFDFDTSRLLCQHLSHLNSDVLTLEDDNEWNFIATNFQKLQIPAAFPRLWLGLYRDAEVAGGWKWVSDEVTEGETPPLLRYTRWADGEPTQGYEEQCTQVILSPAAHESKSSVSRWVDESCRFKAPVVCKALMADWETKRKREVFAMKREDQSEEYVPVPKTDN